MFAEFKSFLDKIPEGGVVRLDGIVRNGTLTLVDSNGDVIATATKEELNDEINAIRDFFQVIRFDPRQLVARQGIVVSEDKDSLPAMLAEILARRQ